MKEIVLLTGATGFLGAYLLRNLLHYRNHTIEKIIVLARGHTRKEAQRRVHQGLWGHLPLRQKRGIISLLEVVRGDVSEENLGLSDGVYNCLSKEVTSVYHSAALCEFNIPLAVIRKINVAGTKNLLEFSLACQTMGNFNCFHHISTVAVAGISTGVFYEKDLDLGQRFNNTYEQTKFEAERLAEKYRNKGLPITIYRPGIITGDSKTGYTSNFKMFYQPLHLFSLDLVKEIPADENSCYSLCPVDYTAEAIVRIALMNPSCKNMTYHIVNPHQMYLSYFIDAASKYFGFDKPRIILARSFDFRNFSPLQYSLLEAFIPYFNYHLHFDARNTDSILGRKKINWPKPDRRLLNRLFGFCIRSGFIKKKTTKKGSVLMITLWILALLVIFALSMGQRTLFSLKLAGYQRDSLRASFLAKSGINKAIEVLQKDDDNNYDSLDEPWSTDYHYISDEQARININAIDSNEKKKMLLELFSFAEIDNPEDLRDLVINWTDTDSEPQEQEDKEIFKNQPLRVPEELVLILEYYYEKNGEDKANACKKARAAYDKIKDLITVYPENGNISININTASEKVLGILLKSIAAGVQKDYAGQILSDILKQKEDKKYFTSEDKITVSDDLVPGTSDDFELYTNFKKALTMRSDIFRIDSIGRVGRITKKITAIYDRDHREIVYQHIQSGI